MADASSNSKPNDAADTAVNSPRAVDPVHQYKAAPATAPPARAIERKRQASDAASSTSTGPAGSSRNVLTRTTSGQDQGSKATVSSQADNDTPVSVANASSDQDRGAISTTGGWIHQGVTVMIKDLTPTTTTDWVVHARVIARGPVRKWENLRGGGTLQELFLLDENNDFIRATLFNDAVLKFAETTNPGSACSLSKGKIKFAISGSSTSARETYLSFGDNAEIHPLNAQAMQKVDPDVPCTQFAQLTHLQAKTTVNVIGILLQATPTKRVVSAHGKNLQKRELVLVDDSNARLLCTLWGNNARDEVAEAEGRAVLIKGGQLDDYMGTRSVAAGIGSSFLVAPTLPRADDLTAWYNAGVDHSSFPIVPSP